MAKRPAFLFYSSDFLVGTFLMSFEDRGKYITILSYMHQHGRLNLKTIHNLVGELSDNLSDKFKVDTKGLWYNVRLEEEIAKRNRFLDSCRENGKLGGRPSKEKEMEETSLVIPFEESTPEETPPEKYPFDSFWKTYDKPTDKQSCHTKWKKLAKEDKELIFQRLPAYIAATPERQFRKNPLTYINKKIWLDDFIPEQYKKPKKSAFKQLIETGSYE